MIVSSQGLSGSNPETGVVEMSFPSGLLLLLLLLLNLRLFASTFSASTWISN